MQVLSVTDGDSFNIRTLEGFKVKARLVGVDCPEMGAKSRRGKSLTKPQAGAIEAKRELERLLKMDPEVIPIGQDPYGRSLVEVRLKDGRLVNEMMVAEGFCEAYRGKIQKDEGLYREAEKRAKEAKSRIWGMKNYESPYLFRKRQMR